MILNDTQNERLEGTALDAYFDRGFAGQTKAGAKEYCRMYHADPKGTINGFINGWVGSTEATGGKPGSNGRPTLQQVAIGFPIYVAKKCGGDVIE